MKKVFLFCAFLSFLSAEVDLKAQAEEGLKAYRAKDYDKAIRISKELCDGGVKMSCLLLATSIYYKEGKETKEVVLAHEKACSPASEILAYSCGLAAVEHLTGKGVSANVEKALELYKKGCKYGDKKSCESEKELIKTIKNINKDLNNQVQEGFKAFQAEDYTKAIELLKKPCDSGMKVACPTLGVSIYRKESKVTKELISAHEKGCGSEHESLIKSCNLAAQAYVDGGVGVAPDLYKAIELYKKACEYGDKDSCETEQKLTRMEQGGRKTLNILTGRPEKADYQSIEKELESSCNANDLNACYKLSKMRLQGSFGAGTNIYGKLQFKDERDMKILEKACDGGVLGACNNLGFVYVVSMKFADANKHFKPACDKGDMMACGNYGEALKALGNDNEGKAYIKKACENGAREFCQHFSITFILE